jgi:hypothetical protein
MLNGQPTFERTNMTRTQVNADLSALTTQVMLSVALPLDAGEVITNLAFCSGATAADTPLNWWFALYDPSGAKLAQTVDKTTTAWDANTVKTLALSTPQTIAEPGVYSAAIMMKATAPVTLVGASLGLAVASTGFTAASKVLAQTSGSALTATAPSTIATPTAVATVPYVQAT